MQPGSFSGLERLIALVDEAVKAVDPDRITKKIMYSLCDLIGSGELRLSSTATQACRQGYARRLLYRSPDLGYTVVAMTWGPGQGTPIHDHAGMWCVEGVCEGRLEVEQFELMERSGSRCRFEPREVFHAGIGSAGCLIPPRDYHRIFNPETKSPSVSIHIYGGEMDCCHAFDPAGDGWCVGRKMRLGYTPSM